MIAVSGATGTISSELVRILIEEDVPFRALTRDPGRAAPIDAGDVAAVAARLLRRDDGHDGSVHVLTRPEPIDHHRVAEAIAKAIGQRVSYVPTSSEEAGEAMRSLGLPPWLIVHLTFLAEVAAAGEADLVTDEVRRWTGRPVRTIEVFARDYAAAFTD